MRKNKKINNVYGFILALGLGLSSQAMAQAAGDCANTSQDKISSKDSSCLPLKFGVSTIDTPEPITGVTKNHSQSAIFPFQVPAKSCTTPWGEVIPNKSGVIAHLNPTGTYNYSTGAWGSECQEELRFCIDGNLSGSYQYKTCTLAPVNGTCGSGYGAYYTYPTSGPSFGELCNPQYTLGGNPDGSPNTQANNGPYLDTNSNIYTWTCSGEAGGSTASCYAYRRINAECGGMDSCTLGNMGSHSDAPGSYQYDCPPSSILHTCTPNAPPATGQTCVDTTVWAQCTRTYIQHNWQCLGINGGSNASCSYTQYTN